MSFSRFLMKVVRLSVREIRKCVLMIFLKYPLYFLGIRLLQPYARFVGHLAHDTDFYVKEGILGLRPHQIGVMVIPRGIVANPHLLNYWRKYITVITSPLVYHLIEPLTRDKKLMWDRARYTGTIDEYHPRVFPAIQRAWGNRPPLLTLREEDRKKGWECLQSLGVPRDAWFVCLHAREPGYVYPFKSAEVSRQYHEAQHHHNIDIFSYIPAIKAITSRGGWCIRLGAPGTKLLPAMDGLIDYAHLPVRSDWMDVFLCASCKFLLAGSGIGAVPTVFGVPCARANRADYEAVLLVGPHDINTPKLVRSVQDNRYLTFKEVFDSPISYFNHGIQYDEAGVVLEDNSPDDVRELVLEMLDYSDGTAVYTDEDERLQVRFKALMHPEHLSYGAGARIGRDFLRKYRHLLPE